MLSWSENFTQNLWAKVDALVIPNSIASPDNTMLGTKLYETTGANVRHRLVYNIPVASATNYTMSIFAKAAERSRLYFYDNGGSSNGARFDIQQGTVISKSPTTNTSITSV